jgi:hypothetical protein
MSTTLHLVCDNCRETLWVGQRNYLYWGENRFQEKLESFLLKHRCFTFDNHKLRMTDDHDESTLDYKDYEENQDKS